MVPPSPAAMPTAPVAAVVPHRLTPDDLDLLGRAGALVAASLDYEVTLKNIAQLMVPQLADYCHVHVVESEAPVPVAPTTPLALTHADSLRAEWAQDLRRRYPSVLQADVDAVVRTGEPVLYRDFTDDMMRERAVDEEHLRQVLTARVASVLVVPLTARGRTLGAITLIGAESGRRYSEPDLPMIGVIAGQCAIAMDNTLWYQKAQTAQTRYRTLFEATPDGTLVIGEDGRFLDANPAMEVLCGYPRSELTKMRVGDLTVEGAGPPSLFLAVKHGQVRAEAVIRRKDGTALDVDTHATPVSLPGETVYVSVLRDITAQKRAAAEIARLNVDLERRVDERTAELRLANKEQESFVYTVSHDLRAPLVSLQGLTAIVLEDFGDELPDEVLAHLRRVDANAGKMQDLITDLLELSRVRRVDIQRGPVDLEAVVRGVCEQFEHTLRERGGTVRVCGSLPTVWANETRMAQIFTNLVDNAIKYTPPERAPFVEIATAEGPGGWEFIVRDNGVGIPPAWQEKALELFQRLPAGKALNPSGTGVGLAIVARIVESKGGRLWMESAEGIGTTFHVVLPRPPGHAATVPSGTDTTPVGAGRDGGGPMPATLSSAPSPRGDQRRGGR